MEGLGLLCKCLSGVSVMETHLLPSYFISHQMYVHVVCTSVM